MKRTFNISLFTVMLATMFFLACSKDKDNDKANSTPTNNVDMPAKISNPADLKDGQAEFSAAGEETFKYTAGTSSWINSGAMGFLGRNYAITEIVISNKANDVELDITLLVHDSTADINGGKLPTAGTYKIALGLDEAGSKNTEKFAQISVHGNGLKHWYNDDSFDGNSQGSVVINSFKNNVFEGSVAANGLYDNGAILNVAASFKATQK